MVVKLLRSAIEIWSKCKINPDHAIKEAKQQNEIIVSPKYPMDKTRIINNFLYYVTPEKRTDTVPLNGMGSWLSSKT